MTTPHGALKIISAFIKFQYNNSALLRQAVRRRRATGDGTPFRIAAARARACAFEIITLHRQGVYYADFMGAHFVNELVCDCSRAPSSEENIFYLAV
jgi:hypothetical protein